jgi:hypothetical protein
MVETRQHGRLENLGVSSRQPPEDKAVVALDVLGQAGQLSGSLRSVTGDLVKLLFALLDGLVIRLRVAPRTGWHTRTRVVLPLSRLGVSV